MRIQPSALFHRGIRFFPFSEVMKLPTNLLGPAASCMGKERKIRIRLCGLVLLALISRIRHYGTSLLKEVWVVPDTRSGYLPMDVAFDEFDSAGFDRGVHGDRQAWEKRRKLFYRNNLYPVV